MKCPKCQYENREGAKFCKECGTKLELACPSCGHAYRAGARFCDECGRNLEKVVEAEKAGPQPEGERKYVTVLFSDLSGYTAMSEKLDPEEVKEMMSRIFREIARVVAKYEGFIEKFVSDAVMALFGVPKAHEDDPLKAVRAAREIHDLVDAMSPELEKRSGLPISMHTGINTGLVVTGEVDMEKGTHGVAGDTINLASRLCSLAKPGEILVGHDTFRQTEGHFSFESMEPTTVKGKAEPVEAHKVLSQKERPITIRRLTGLRANLIGRKGEMAELGDAVERLRGGKGSIFSICGDAGTGKSRLVKEFKASLDLREIQWFEGHAYAYAQNIPYFPLMNLLNGIFHIEERDSSEKIREKIESRIKDITGNSREIAPYVGNLYALTYPELGDVSAELWKHRLEESVKAILTALARYAVEEAHEYYKKAYDILAPKEDKAEEDKRLLIDMLNSWGYVYYYLGEINEWINLFNSHKDLVESLGDDARLGMFHAWLGIAYYMAGRQQDSYDYLRSALDLGERCGDRKVAGYACAWLTFPCALSGLFDEGLGYGTRAQEISKSFPSDQYVFFKSLGGMCWVYAWQGSTKKLFEGAKRLLDYGEKTANSRSKVFGHWLNAFGHYRTGDIELVQVESEKAVDAALDPFYAQFPKPGLGASYFSHGRLQEAEGVLESLLDFCEKRGLGLLSLYAQLLLSAILIAKGQMKRGFQKFEETQEVLLKNHLKIYYAQSESILGMVYTQLITGPSPGFTTLAGNIGFMVENVPFAGKKAEQHFNKAIELLIRKMGAKVDLGQAFLGLGQLYKAKKKKEKARECLSEAAHLFQECDAHVYLKQAKKALTSIP